MKIITQYSFTESDFQKSDIEGPSMTIPDEALSIEELFIRASRGEPLTNAGGYYDDEEGFEYDDIALDQAENDPLLDPSLRNIDRLTIVNDELNVQSGKTKLQSSVSNKKNSGVKSSDTLQSDVHDSESSDSSGETVPDEG